MEILYRELVSISDLIKLENVAIYYSQFKSDPTKYIYYILEFRGLDTCIVYCHIGSEGILPVYVSVDQSGTILSSETLIKGFIPAIKTEYDSLLVNRYPEVYEVYK